MEPPKQPCALFADRHLGLSEGIRDLLEAVFHTVYVVADLESLSEGAERLAPTLVVVDLSLAGSALAGLLARIRDRSPGSRVIVLSLHDQPSTAEWVMDSGADGIVLKRCAGAEFLPAVDLVMDGGIFVSPEFGLAPRGHSAAPDPVSR